MGLRGAQRTRLMRLLFRQIQALDGFEFTEPNALGCIPGVLEAAGLADADLMARHGSADTANGLDAVGNLIGSRYCGFCCCL